LLLVCLSATAQKDKAYVDYTYPPNPKLVDDQGIGLSIQLGDNQAFNKKHNNEILITPPTVINTEKRNDGVFYVKCYVNSDGINIVASKVNASNVKNYLVYYQTAQSDSVPNIDRTKAHPAFFATAEGNPTYIHLNDFNKIKHWG